MGPLKIYTGLLLGMDITGREVGTIFGTILIRALDRNLAKSASAAPAGEQRVNSGRASTRSLTASAARSSLDFAIFGDLRAGSFAVFAASV